MIRYLQQHNAEPGKTDRSVDDTRWTVNRKMVIFCYLARATLG